MRKRALRAALAAVVLLPAYGCGWWEPGLETRTFRVDHLQPHEVGELVDPYVYTDRVGAPGRFSMMEGALTVRERPDNLDKIARVLEEFDVARPDLRLRFQLVRADGASGAPDPAIAHVVEELRRIFRFQGYELVGEVVVTAGGGQLRPTFPGLTYGLRTDVFPRTSGAVRLHELTLWDEDTDRTLLTTSVTVQPGQTLVLGSAPSTADDGGAVILTVRAESDGESAR